NSLLSIDLSIFFDPAVRERVPLDDFFISLAKHKDYSIPLNLILKKILWDVPGERHFRITQAYNDAMRDNHNNIMAFLEKLYPEYLRCDLRLKASDFQTLDFSDSEEIEARNDSNHPG
ncbi:MAG TPA: hypothetical protein DDY37_01640, partial [Legionella sp.]|nr:hypothetical protein [Legionella sp.]